MSCPKLLRRNGWANSATMRRGKWGQVVHTLGNLTLSAYNAELSNQPFAAKRQALVESHFVLNQHFKEIDQWTDARIRERGTILAQRALQVWPDVGRIPGSLEREKRPGSTANRRSLPRQRAAL